MVLCAVLEHDSLVEYALRQTLVADSLSLQFRLPPPGIPAPVARRSAAIANGTDVVDALVVTSVWAVHLLRTLSQVSFLTNSCLAKCSVFGCSSRSKFELLLPSESYFSWMLPMGQV